MTDFKQWAECLPTDQQTDLRAFMNYPTAFKKLKELESYLESNEPSLWRGLELFVKYVSQNGSEADKKRILTTVDKAQSEKASFRKFYEAYKKDMNL